MDVVAFIGKAIVLLFWFSFVLFLAALFVIIVRETSFSLKMRAGSSVAIIVFLTLIGMLANFLAGTKVLVIGLVAGILVIAGITISNRIFNQKEE